MGLKKINISTWLPIAMVLLAAVSLTITSFFSYHDTREVLLKDAELRLTGLAADRRSKLDLWLEGVDKELETIAEASAAVTALEDFSYAWSGLSSEGSATAALQRQFIDENPFALGDRDKLEVLKTGGRYSQAHQSHHPVLRTLGERGGYYDLFLIDNSGNVIYSVEKEADFATNILTGPYKSSGLSVAFQKVVQIANGELSETAAFTDFEPYAPSAGAPASFVGRPIYSQFGNMAGAVVLQLPTDKVAALLTDSAGLGETGDAFLLSSDGELKTQPRTFADQVPLQAALDETALERLNNSEASVLQAVFFGEPVLVGKATLNFHGTTWKMVVVSRMSEVFERAAELRNSLIVQVAATLAIIVVIGFFLARSVSKPLLHVASDMRRVAGRDYDTTVRGLSRGDEIGQIAGTLDEFRTKLGSAEEQQLEAMLKGAAFQSGSGAMFVMNGQKHVVYANESFFELLGTLGLNCDEDDLDQPIAKLAPFLEDAVTKTSSFPTKLDVSHEDQQISVTMNDIIGENDEVMGIVVEVGNVTERRTTAAILDAIEQQQAKVELTPTGDIISANEIYKNAVGEEGMRNGFFANFRDLADNRALRWQDVIASGGYMGLFELTLSSGHTVNFEGGFHFVRDQDDDVRQVVLLANDVTKVQQAIAVSEAARKETAQAQKQVVDALKMGLDRLADGELTVRLHEPFHEDYEMLRDNFNRTCETLMNAIAGVGENAETIRGEAAEISSAADSLSQRTERQAASLEETAAALDELTTSVASAAQGAKTASDVVIEARTNAEESGEVVQQAVVAMGEIESSSGQISKISGVIEDIAFQTNLLALNAGVEAARAGDAGRGFAVVASEVRALAQRSSDAAREINDLIAQSTTQVQKGVGLVGNTGTALTGLVQSVKTIAEHVSEIAQSAQEQSGNLAEINSAINELDQVTQQNAAMFEETTAASHSLTQQANALRASMAKFVTTKGVQNVVDMQPNRTVKQAIETKRPMAVGETGEAVLDDGWEEF
ncbi:methyl-accepting chemotaxis protein [Nereida ignava]|uniref:Ribose and galactose chemoreceptor protein n=1 Tax=Nereida ignava TaxID=282199 RepID=A0A0U1NHG8_9RHOB|nr:methyl-accepting chemotaxis protein [Nereida ignava]CRK74186.1 Ribose and galactose chemoreceptor protein [Nereida ignava]SFJ25923.1 methyl-accepting chemotaxis sensory transducer with Pas/Pac sensor [Nereida ignava DSM 16309]